MTLSILASLFLILRLLFNLKRQNGGSLPPRYFPVSLDELALWLRDELFLRITLLTPNVWSFPHTSIQLSPLGVLQFN